MSTITTPTKAERIATVLNSLPSYAECFVVAESDYAEPRTFHLMVRDRPSYSPDIPRRCTCLTTGTEWFIEPGMLERMGIEQLDVVSFDTRNDDPLWRIS